MLNYTQKQSITHYQFLITILICLVFRIDANSQLITSLRSGASSVDIELKSPEGGTFYYIVSKTAITNPAPIWVKQSALVSISGSIVRNGKAVINFTEVNKSLIRQITNLPDNKPYYIYGVFENFTSGLKNVQFFNVTLPSRQIAMEYISSVSGIAGKTVKYLIYKPEASLKTQSQASPLLLFFHGDNEKGTDINLVKRNGPPKLINDGNDLDFTVVSPQVCWPIQWDTPGFLEEFVRKIKSINFIDTNKIYITAISGGGGGLYYYTKTNPSKVTAIIPVSAVSIMKTGEFCSLKNIPFWGFHNSDDPIVGVGNLNSVVYGINLCIPVPAIIPLKTIYQAYGHDAWTITYNNFQIYSWLLAKSKTDKFNQAPQVTLGKDITINTSATLNSLAIDNDGTIIKYVWEKKNGPDVTVINSNTSSILIKDLNIGTYTFRLTVTDNKGGSAYDDINVNVVTNPINRVPVVSAGDDINLKMPFVAPTLTGVATDSDGTITGYAWTKTSGPEAVLSGVNSAQLILENLTVGAYTFQLVVADNEGAIMSDEVSVTVEQNLSFPSGGDGLIGNYYNKNDLTGSPVLIRTDSIINFNWGSGSPFSPIISVNNFSIRWEGMIQVPKTDLYTFYSLSDDGVRLWVDGTQIINNWVDHPLTTNSGVINLVEMQKYPIVMEYYEAWGNAIVKLLWSYAGQGIQIIPKTRLFSNVTNTSTRMANESIIKEDLIIYPNPASDLIYIEYLSSDESDALVTISDITDRSIEKYHFDLTAIGINKFSFQTKKLASGVYHLNFTTNKSKIIRRIVIE